MAVEYRAPVPPPIVVPKVSSNVVIMDEFLPNVYSPPKRTKVVLFNSSMTPLPAQQKLSKCCTSAGYSYEVMTSSADVDKYVSDDHANEIIVVLPVRYPLDQETLSVLSLAKSDLPVVAIAILLSQSTMDEDMITLANSGVTRILTTDEVQQRLTQELRLAERNELRLKRILLFSRALMEGVENSHDAIQVTTRESRIMYVNRSFCEMNGYPREECLGRLASDMLHAQDGKMLLENGKKHAEYRKEPWEGDFLGRRKSGSLVRQHFKLLPIRAVSGLTTHHVTIQRMMSNHDFITGMSSPKFSMHPELFGGTRSARSSLGNVTPLAETPLNRTVHLLNTAKELASCSAEVKDIVDKCIEILRSPTGLHVPVMTSSHSRGIVEGLLNNGRRFSGTDSDSTRKSFSLTPSHVQQIHQAILEPQSAEIEDALSDLATWDFDVIALERICQPNQPLYFVGMKIFKEFNVCETMQIPDFRFRAWLKLMENHYHRDNSYHNSTHAADVLQATAFLIRHLQTHPESLLYEKMEPLEVAAMLISATIHDLGHPGRTNPFLCNSGSELTLLYNDRAVLENHHVSLAFKLTVNNEAVNIFQNLDFQTYHVVRATIIDVVLATDMSSHFEHLSKFTASSIFVPEEPAVPAVVSNIAPMLREERVLLRRILLKCADIANACRPEHLCEVWAKRIAEEYFQQTEEEKARKLPIVFPDFDRATCVLPATQVRFIDYFVVGLFDTWNMCCPIPELIRNIAQNHATWQRQLETEEEEEVTEAAP